jgi:hypothetical protein
MTPEELKRYRNIDDEEDSVHEDEHHHGSTVC